jgi:hypothetical protein
MEDVVREPIALIDEDLDEVAGGVRVNISHNFSGVGNDSYAVAVAKGYANTAIANNGNIVGSFNTDN